MTTEAKYVIEQFGALPDPTKREVLTELIRMSQNLEYPEISDEELRSAANDLFLEYDRRETGE